MSYVQTQILSELKTLSKKADTLIEILIRLDKDTPDANH